jgi:RES domain-containing protein
LRWQGTCYRAHDPKWAFQPASGAGAATIGGRFNPAGTPALYLAMSIEGMFLEMNHGFAHRLDPLTVCSYVVDVDDLVDLRTERNRKAAKIDMADMGCAWFDDLSNGEKPASWTVVENLMTTGASGIITPSFAHGARADMTNLVLWKWGLDLPYKVEVHDPTGRLPRDQSSWGMPKP